VKDATERLTTTAATTEAANNAGARNQNPSKSPVEAAPAKANNISILGLKALADTPRARQRHKDYSGS
jgi:hypothetical protein